MEPYIQIEFAKSKLSEFILHIKPAAPLPACEIRRVFFCWAKTPTETEKGEGE